MQNPIKVALLCLLILITPLLAAVLIGWQSNRSGEYSINVLMIYGIFGCIVYIFAPNFFVKIPNNHVVCVIAGGRFLHYMCHLDDKEKLKLRIAALPSGHKLKVFKFETLITREDHPIWGLFVRLFNLHFKSWIPSSLKEIKIVRTRMNTSYNNNAPIDQLVQYDNGTSEQKTPFLRLEFPRIIYLGDVELQGNVQVNVVVSVTGMCVLDLHEAFFVHTDVSAWIDIQLRQALVNYLGTLTFEAFAEHDFTSNPANAFNLFMRDANALSPNSATVQNAGISVIGVKIEGSASVVEYNLSDSQAALREAKVRREAAEVEKATEQLRAEAAAIGIRLEGEAKALVEAEVIRQKGAADADARLLTGAAEAEAIRLLKQAEAEGALALAKAIRSNPDIVQVLVSQAIAASKVTTYVQSTPGGPTPPVIIQP